MDCQNDCIHFGIKLPINMFMKFEITEHAFRLHLKRAFQFRSISEPLALISTCSFICRSISTRRQWSDLLGVTGWSDSSGKLPGHFGPPLGKRSGYCTPRGDSETLMQKWPFRILELSCVKCLRTQQMNLPAYLHTIPFMLLPLVL